MLFRSNIDVLDYRIAANILETTSDTLVEIANSLSNTTLSKNDLKKIYELTKDIESIHQKSIDSMSLVNSYIFNQGH